MVKVKICGLTNLSDALAAIECGADAVGFIFAPSRRQVTPEVVRDIIAELPPFVTKVGVFVDSDLAELRQAMTFCGLDFVQLHGSEGPEICEAFYPKVVKTFNAESLPSAQELERFRVAALMIDREKGSTIQPERIWPLASEMSAYGRVVLAGGLTPQNVARAVEAVRPYAVDVAGGVESSPGKKDHRKMKDFINAAKGLK